MSTSFVFYGRGLSSIRSVHVVVDTSFVIINIVSHSSSKTTKTGACDLLWLHKNQHSSISTHKYSFTLLRKSFIAYEEFHPLHGILILWEIEELRYVHCNQSRWCHAGMDCYIIAIISRALQLQNAKFALKYQRLKLATSRIFIYYTTSNPVLEICSHNLKRQASIFLTMWHFDFRGIEK